MRCSTGTSKKLRCGLLLAALAAGSLVRANPTGGSVASGSATITTVPGTVTINQSSNNAIINWQSFSIAAGELTQFQVPSITSATLNRVTGGNASLIYGTLESNGQIYLLNPNGILVGRSGQIDTAGFIASTLDVSDDQFNQRGDLNFFGDSTAAVNNRGTIHASDGDVYLIAAQVKNSGTISAPNGTVGLAAGTEVLFQSAGDQHLFVEGAPTTTSKATGVSNSGTITAATAELKAAGGNAYALAINNSGNIAATGIANINGQIYLTSDGGDITTSGAISAKQANGDGGTVVIDAHSSPGGATQGTLIDSGSIVANGTANSNNVGGTVELLGDRVAMTGSARVDVSGNAGGGTALLGGDEHGANPDIPDASQTFLGSGATIDADALASGNGGKVILWGNDTTQVYGQISARGGPQGGNGGIVETSGSYLDAQTVPDVSAPQGTGGTWLLDPYDLDIVATGTSNTSVNTDGSGDTFFSSNDPSTPSILTVGDIAAALANGSVQVNAIADNDSSITWEPGANLDYGTVASSSGQLNLSLMATGVITLNGVTISNQENNGNTLNLNFYQYNDGTQTYGDSVRIINSNINLNGGSLYVQAAINPANVVNDFASAPSDAAIFITGSTIQTVGAGSIDLNGTGVANAGIDSVGVEINASTLTAGTSENPDTGGFYIQGYSDPGYDYNPVTVPPLSSTSNSAYGVLITGNSQLTYYTTPDSSNHFAIHGHSYANNSQSALGTLIDASTVQIYNGHLSIKGDVDSENDNGVSDNFAYQIIGVVLDDAQVQSSGTSSTNANLISIEGSSQQEAIATDGGDTTVSPENVGVVVANNSQVTATGDSTFLSVPISIDGQGGQAETSSGNLNTAIASGVVIEGNSDPTLSTISNDGLGAIAIGGLGGTATGPSAVADGLDIFGGAGTTQDVIAATGNGNIALAGMGGVISPGSGAASFTGNADGIAIGSFSYTNGGTLLTSAPAEITTTGGSMIIIAAAGAVDPSATLPSVSSVNLTGLDLKSATLSTDLTTPAGAPAVPDGGGVIPPMILIMATDSTVTPRIGPSTFQLGSPTGYAINEDAASGLITGNLVLGNYYDALTAQLPAVALAKVPTLASFMDLLTNQANYISTYGITDNPSGQISLTSHLNQIDNLDSALVGTGGLDLYDSTSLVVDVIGSSDNSDFGDIDEAAEGPVTIQTAGNLSLTNVSQLTGVASSLPVIASDGTGDDITLITGGVFTNYDDSSTPTLTATGGATYVIYSNDVNADNVGNLTDFTPIFDTPYTGTRPADPGNLIVFSGATGTVHGGPIGGPTVGGGPTGGGDMDDPGNPMSPIVPIQDALIDVPLPGSGGENPVVGGKGDGLNQNTSVAGGAGGVDTGGHPHDDHGHLHDRLVQLYGQARANEIMQVIEKDFRDGSPVNTGSLVEKWAANSGLSEIVQSGGFAQLGLGEALPFHYDPFIFNQFGMISNAGALQLLGDAAFGGHHSGNGTGH